MTGAHGALPAPAHAPRPRHAIDTRGTRRTSHTYAAHATSRLRIKDDLQTLEAPGYGNADQLAKAHRTLTAPSFSTAEATDTSFPAPYCFPAATQLTGLRALSDALIGRLEWDSPAVLRERDIVLGPEAEAFVFINEWQIRGCKNSHFGVSR